MEDGGFEEWYREWRDQVMAVLWALSGDRGLAEDAAAEAFARALARWARVREMDRPGGWVMTVAVNVLRRTQRRRGSENALLRRLPPVPVVEVQLPDEAVWLAVRALPARQGLAVTLRYVSDLPEAEVARIMGVRRGTVASQLAAARASLAEVLADEKVLRG